MKTEIVLADAVTDNHDGTFSVLRGGIDRINIPAGQPFLFRAGMVIRFVATASELGKHQFRIVCVNEDGVTVAPELNGGLEMNEVGGIVIAVNTQVHFPKPGRYTFAVSVDGHEMNSYSFSVREVPTRAAGKPE